MKWILSAASSARARRVAPSSPWGRSRTRFAPAMRCRALPSVTNPSVTRSTPSRRETGGTSAQPSSGRGSNSSSAPSSRAAIWAVVSPQMMRTPGSAINFSSATLSSAGSAGGPLHTVAERRGRTCMAMTVTSRSGSPSASRR